VRWAIRGTAINVDTNRAHKDDELCPSGEYWPKAEFPAAAERGSPRHQGNRYVTNAWLWSELCGRRGVALDS
jgi:hypothetical protein